MPLVYVILFYFIFFLCFLCFIGLWKKKEHSGSLGLNGQEFGQAGRRSRKRDSVQAIERKILAIERTSARVPKKRIERTCVRTQKQIDHKAIDRRLTAIERTYA